MNFNFKMFNWNNSGAEPSDNLKTNGFKQGYKPAAGVFNKFWYLVTNAITELQTKIGAHAEDKANPHGVTAAQVGLDKVNNTADSEKSVNFASTAGVGRKVEHSLEIHLNGGRTEGTDLWTYDGSTSRSVNITPKKIRAAEETHTHETTDINGLRGAIDKIVAATSTDGVTYTATIDGITELYEGLEITICPDTSNTSNAMTLNLNGLGAKPIRRPLSFSTYVADSAKSGFLHKDAPCRLMYHAEYPNRVDGVSGDGIWLMADKVKTSAQDLYGTVPTASGGTGKVCSILADVFYPVGSIYMSVNDVSPANLFGGTWERIENRFLYGAPEGMAGINAGSETHKHTGEGLFAAISAHKGNEEDTVYIRYQEIATSEHQRTKQASCTNLGVSDTNAWYSVGTAIGGETTETEHLPPYLMVNMWKRTA